MTFQPLATPAPVFAAGASGTRSTNGGRLWRKVKALFTTANVMDYGERAVITGLIMVFQFRIFGEILAGKAAWVACLVCFGELLIVGFILFRRHTAIASANPVDWAIAFGATAAPTMADAGGDPLLPLWMLGSIGAASIAGQLIAKLCLNRSFGIVPANRGVVTIGLYRFVRHPIYATYLLGHIAMLLTCPTVWNLSVYTIAWSLQIVRIAREERILGLDPTYQDYRSRVRHRLIPGVY